MCCYHLRIHSVSLSCVFSPPLAGLLSIAFLPSLSLSSSLSPHLMRPHNNTAVVQLFCYLSQTAGSLHSVFLVPFACLLRQGNEYHSERRSTQKKKKKERSDIWGYTSKHHFVGIVSRLIKEFHTQSPDKGIICLELVVQSSPAWCCKCTSPGTGVQIGRSVPMATGLASAQPHSGHPSSQPDKP